MQIRLNPSIFDFVASAMKQSRETIDSCVESFTYSFFLDLVHPESTEAELLKAIQRLIHSELLAIKNSGVGHVSGLLHESYVLKNMLRHYLKRRNQRKYMKLIFKKGLRDIIHNQEMIKNIKLDPKQIYLDELKKEKVFARNSVPVISKEKKGFFNKKKDSKKFETVEKIEKPFENISTEDAMHNEEVYKIVVDRSFHIIEHCKSLLKGIYNNVDTMPFGLRWICKQMIFLIQETVPDVKEIEKFTLLGNFLFTN